MLKGILVSPTQEELTALKDYEQRFRQKTDNELAESYFRELKIGMTGVRMQMIYIIALRKVLLERFGNSPIEFDGIVLEL